MGGYLGGAVVTIECSVCGNRIKETAAHLRSQPAVRCSDCGTTVCVDAGQLRTALAQFAIAFYAHQARMSTAQASGLEHLPALTTH